ncbi:hypothetical protein SLEP1_g45842 [Rubroshorea leprosula]|uniref:Uncharacterized protein n=1 Tax=Rubroshorea leprosula TaxID=152421 RepID=A0AAV5LKL0_9ROSI|nr:hypothetical protein SLEP1_g45842 [Rubroshorea leprosula]
MSPVTEATEAKAEVHYRDETCRDKFTFLPAEIPDSQLTVEDIEEGGRGHRRVRVREGHSVFFIDTIISYAAVITAYFQPNKIKNLTGVKAREFMIWINLTEICVEEEHDSQSGFITFRTLVGLSRSIPLSLFGAWTADFQDKVDGSKEENW